MFSPSNAVQYYTRDNLLENAKNYSLHCYVDLLLLTEYIRVFFVWGQLIRKKCCSHRNCLNYVSKKKKDEKMYFNCG